MPDSTRTRARAERSVAAFLGSMLGARPAWSELDVEELLAGPPGQNAVVRSPRWPWSANQRCRMLRTGDGWCAVHLAGETELRSLPAVIESRVVGDPWDALVAFADGKSTVCLVDRCRLLQIPAAVVNQSLDCIAVNRVSVDGPALISGPISDLSSLWAGPLCATLIGLGTGLPVTDVESRFRPDPLRLRGGEFTARLHRDRALLTFDHQTTSGRLKLAEQLARSSVVVTAGTARSLDSLELDPAAWVAATGGVWVHVSGFGLTHRLADVRAFGDDAAVAGGLIEWERGRPSFVRDAVADPVTGVRAAVAALAALDGGGAAFLDVSLVGSAASVIHQS